MGFFDWLFKTSSKPVPTNKLIITDLSPPSEKATIFDNGNFSISVRGYDFGNSDSEDFKRKINSKPSYSISCPRCCTNNSIDLHYFVVFDSWDGKVASGFVFRQKNAEDIFFEVPYVVDWSTCISDGLKIRELSDRILLQLDFLFHAGEAYEKKTIECRECGGSVLSVCMVDFKVAKGHRVKRIRKKAIKVFSIAKAD